MSLFDVMAPIGVLILGFAGILYLSFWFRHHTISRKGDGKSGEALLMLSSRQRTVFREAQNLMDSGQEEDAAKIFKGLGIHQKAVEALLRAKKIDEACSLLEQTGAEDRAAYILGANGRWQEAQKIFLRNGHFLEAAKCAEELGHLDDAARMFEQAGHPLEAAALYETLQNRQRSTRLYIAGGQVEKACHILDTALGNKATKEETRQAHEIIETMDQTELYLVIHFLTQSNDGEMSFLRLALTTKSLNHGEGMTNIKSIAG